MAGLRHLPTPPTTCCTSSLSRVPWPLRSPPPSLHTFPGTEEKETWESPQEALIRVTTQTNFPGIWGVGEHLPTEDQAKTFAGGLFAEPKGKADTVWLPDGFRDHLAKRDLGNPSPTPAAHALETWLLVMPEEVRRWCQWVAVSGSIQGGASQVSSTLGFHPSGLDPHDSLQRGRDCRALPVKLMPSTSNILMGCSRMYIPAPRTAPWRGLAVPGQPDTPSPPPNSHLAALLCHLHSTAH